MTGTGRLFLAAAGGAGILCFLLPVFTGRIINIGNELGFSFSAVLLLYGLLQNRIHLFLRAVWDRGGTPVRAVLVFSALAALAAAAVVLVLSGMIVRSAMIRPDPHANVILLGCEVKGEKPSRMLKSRIDAAAEWLNANPGTYCVLSGGKGEDENISEAECMYRYLTEAGISPERLIKEERSVSTRENIRFSLEILKEKGIVDKTAAETEAAVVTNEFHECRASLIAKEYGIRAGAVPAASPWWLLPTFYVRELCALAAYFIWGSPTLP